MDVRYVPAAFYMLSILFLCFIFRVAQGRLPNIFVFCFVYWCFI